tara:strand:+ start:455 stop:973 length:519 start_codon:yes stop_codon:yes gene_type:complete
MTKKLEETFNISDGEDEDKNTPTIEESQEITELLNTEIENTEKIDAALPMVTDLNEHDREMDDIHAKALKTFEDLLQLGMNVEVHAGAKILETANQLLKTAKEAKDSKVDRKLRMINLQLQKAKLDHQKDKDTSKTDEEITAEGSLNIDRNELLKRIASAQKVAEEVKEQNK